MQALLLFALLCVSTLAAKSQWMYQFNATEVKAGKPNLFSHAGGISYFTHSIAYTKFWDGHRCGNSAGCNLLMAYKDDGTKVYITQLNPGVSFRSGPAIVKNKGYFLGIKGTSVHFITIDMVAGGLEADIAYDNCQFSGMGRVVAKGDFVYALASSFSQTKCNITHFTGATHGLLFKMSSDFKTVIKTQAIGETKYSSTMTFYDFVISGSNFYFAGKDSGDAPLIVKMDVGTMNKTQIAKFKVFQSADSSSPDMRLFPSGGNVYLMYSVGTGEFSSIVINKGSLAFSNHHGPTSALDNELDLTNSAFSFSSKCQTFTAGFRGIAGNGKGGYHGKTIVSRTGSAGFTAWTDMGNTFNNIAYTGDYMFESCAFDGQNVYGFVKMAPWDQWNVTQSADYSYGVQKFGSCLNPPAGPLMTIILIIVLVLVAAFFLMLVLMRFKIIPAGPFAGCLGVEKKE